MQKGYVSLPIGFRRVDNTPLEKNTLFKSLELARNYAHNDRTAYVGQILSVVESGKVKGYIINNDKTLRCFSEDHEQIKVEVENKSGGLTIDHQLGRIPGVKFVLNDGTEVVPNIVYSNEAQICVEWNGELSGTIYLI